MLTALLVCALQFDAIATWAARGIARTALRSTSLRISIARAGGSWIRSVDLKGVRLAGPGHETLASFDSLRVAWSWLPLLRHTVELRVARLNGAYARLYRGEGGRIGLEGWPPGNATTRTDESGAGSSWRLRIRALEITDASGSLVSRIDAPRPRSLPPDRDSVPPDPDRIVAVSDVNTPDGAVSDSVAIDWAGLQVHARDITIGSHAIARRREIGITVDSAAGRLDVPDLAGRADEGPLEFRLSSSFHDGQLTLDTLDVTGWRSRVRGSGRVLSADSAGAARPIEFHLQIDSFPLAVVQAILGRPTDPHARLDAGLDMGGTTRLMTASVAITTTDGGRVHGSAAFTPATSGPVRYRAALQLSNLDPGYVTGDRSLAGRIDGRIDVDLDGATRAMLSGRASAHLGTLRLASFDLDRGTLDTRWTEGEAQATLELSGPDLELEAGGTLRPFDATPAWQAHGPFRIALPAGPFRPVHIQGQIATSGAGSTLGDAKARLAVDLSTAMLGRASFDDGHIAAQLDDGVLEWSLGLRSDTFGRIAARGSASPGNGAGFDIESATVRGLDLAAVLGDTVTSRFNADLAGSGRIGSGADRRARGQLLIRDSRWASLDIDSATFDARLDGDVIAADGRLLSTSGEVEARVAADPFGATPRYRIERARFARVDLGPLSGDTTLITDLNGAVRGDVRVAGPGRMSGTLSVDLDTSVVNLQTIPAGTATLSMRDGRSDISATLELGDSGLIRLEGTGEPFGKGRSFEIRQASFEDLDPFALAGVAGNHASLDGRLAGTLVGDSSGTVRSKGELRLTRSRVNLEPVRDGVVEWRLAKDSLNARASLHLDSGSLEATGAIRFGTTPRYALVARLRSARPGRLVGVAGDGWVDATGTFSGEGSNASTLRGRLRLDADSTVLRDVRLDTLRLAVRVDRGTAHVDTLTLRSNIGELTGHGSLPVSSHTVSKSADFEAHGTITALSPIRSWIGDRPASLGTGRFDLTVAGLPDSVRLDAGATASALLLGSTRLIGFQSKVHGTLQAGLKLRDVTAEATLDRLSTGNLTVRQTHLDGRWNGDELTLDGQVGLDERRDIDFSTRIDARPGHQRAVIDRLTARIDQDRWRLAGSPAISWRDGLRLDTISVSSGMQRLQLGGSLDVAGANDLTARITNLRIGGVADLFGFDALDGTLTASLGLRGTATSPRITAGLSADLETRNRASSTLAASITYDTTRLGVNAYVAAGEGGRLAVSGTLPLRLTLAAADSANRLASASGEVDLDVRADSFALVWAEPFIDPTLARTLDGRLDIDAHVRGTQADPTLDGVVRLADAHVTVPQLGVTYRDAAMRITLDGDRATIDSARARSGDGTVSLTGTLSLPELSLGRYDVDARLDRFRLIHTAAWRVTASGNAQLRGTTTQPRLEGQLEVAEADAWLGNTVSEASVRPVDLTPEQIRRLEDYFGMPMTSPQREPGRLYEALAMDLSVSLGRDTWVRQRANPKLELQLTGDVHLTKQPADSLHYDGRVETIAEHSYVEQFGRRFQIDQGVIEMSGLASQAKVNVRAVYSVPSVRDPSSPEVTITLDIDGTVDDLHLALGSEPTMENADIVSYLATGRPAATSLSFQGGGSSGGLGSIGSQLAIDQVTGLVESVATRDIGLDVVDIQADGLRGVTVIAGRFVTPSLYVGFKQPIGRDPEETGVSSVSARTRVELEYDALRWLLLNMQADRSSVSFLFRYKSAY